MKRMIVAAALLGATLLGGSIAAHALSAPGVKLTDAACEGGGLAVQCTGAVSGPSLEGYTVTVRAPATVSFTCEQPPGTSSEYSSFVATVTGSATTVGRSFMVASTVPVAEAQAHCADPSSRARVVTIDFTVATLTTAADSTTVPVVT